MHDWIQDFQTRFGDAVLTDSDTLNKHPVQGVVPSCLCAPQNDVLAAAMIQFAASRKIQVVPCGRGIQQTRCAPPAPGFLKLFTSQLNTLVHHEPGDMVATVQGGMTFGDFSAAIQKRGQWLPLDAHCNSTLGGIVASNTHGPRALGYGTLRDMLLGMTVVNGDGVIRKCGGKVVKNVTGYALDKLYIGSFGTLGLITEVTFKLRPLPVDGIFLKASFSSLKAGLAAMRSIAAKNLPLEMLRLFSSSTYAPQSELEICATGTRPELNRIVAEVRLAVAGIELFGEDEIPCPSLQVPDFSSNKGTRAIARRTITPIKYGATLRFGCLGANLDSALEILEHGSVAFLSVGTSDGIVDLDPLNEAQAARISDGFELLGINFVFENIVGADIPQRWGKPRPEWKLMKQIKSAVDPQGIMNTGRFVV